MRTRRDGFILMAALWLLVALGAVGLDAALRHRARRLAAANLLDETRMRAASGAGAEYARSRLTSAMLGRADELRAEAARAARTAPRQQGRAGQFAVDVTSRAGGNNSMRNTFRGSDPGADPWRDPAALVPASLDWNGVTTTFVLRDPGAALNINGADLTMFSQFFSLGLRLDYKIAGQLAASIIDWRDDDDLPQVGGGEREQYIHDGAAMLPANHSFSNIDELRFVRGMTPEIFAQARPFLRTSTNTIAINVNSAPKEVLLALPGMNEEGATALIRLRRAGTYPRSITELMGMLPSSTVSAISAQAPAAPGGGGGGGGRGGPPGGAPNVANTVFARRVIFATDQVEVIADASVPGSPVHARTQIIVDRALNGAAVTWRQVQ